MESTNAIATASAQDATTGPTVNPIDALLPDVLAELNTSHLPAIRSTFTRLVWQSLKGDAAKTKDAILKSGVAKTDIVLDLIVHGHLTPEFKPDWVDGEKGKGSYAQQVRTARLILGLEDGQIEYLPSGQPTVKAVVKRSVSAGSLGSVTVAGSTITITHGEIKTVYDHGKALDAAKVESAYRLSLSERDALLDDEEVDLPTRRAVIAVKNALVKFNKDRKAANAKHLNSADAPEANAPEGKPEDAPEGDDDDASDD